MDSFIVERTMPPARHPADPVAVALHGRRAADAASLTPGRRGLKPAGDSSSTDGEIHG